MATISDINSAVSKAERSSRGLRDVLFDEIDALRNGNSNPSRATAMSKVAAQIINSVRIEIEHQKYVTSSPLQDGAKGSVLALGKM